MVREYEEELEKAKIILYADKKALEAVKDMPRDFRRIMAFSEAWVKAAKEYVNAHQP